MEINPEVGSSAARPASLALEQGPCLRSRSEEDLAQLSGPRTAPTTLRQEEQEVLRVINNLHIEKETVKGKKDVLRPKAILFASCIR